MHGVCIDKVRGNAGLQLDMRIGSRGSLHCGGAGKAGACAAWARVASYCERADR